jgi:hypothetical protein
MWFQETKSEGKLFIGATKSWTMCNLSQVKKLTIPTLIGPRLQVEWETYETLR